MEHVILSSMMTYGEIKNNIYKLKLNGFGKGRSCEIQLIDDLANNMNAGQQTYELTIDFANAFDKVNHRLLVSKLKACGIREHQYVDKELVICRTQTVVL